jgi:hypothetical protein
MTIEVHRHESHRLRADLAGGVVQIDGVGRVDVDENGHGAREADGLDRREGRVGRDEYLVGRLDAEGPHEEPERGSPAVGQDRVLHTEVGRKLLLERLTFRAENVLARVDCVEHGGLDLVIDRRTGERNRHQRGPGGWRRWNFPR